MSIENLKNSELNINQLDEVTGGEKDMGAYLPADHGRHIGMYEAEAYIGSPVYVVMDYDREDYYYGDLLDSFEAQEIGFTRRVHRVDVLGCNDYWLCTKRYVGSAVNFKGDNCTLFLRE